MKRASLIHYLHNETAILSRPLYISVLQFRRFAAIFGIGLTCGCTQFPELDSTVPDHLENADYPALIQLDASLTTPPTPADDAEKLEKELAARRDALQNRARRLNAPIIDTSTQDRMETGVIE